jgi:hypothetical protein
MIGSPFFTSYDDRMLQRALDATAPGVADIIDLDSLHCCPECRHWLAGRGKKQEGRCALFENIMRGRKAPSPVRSVPYACRKWVSNLGNGTRSDRDAGRSHRAGMNGPAQPIPRAPVEKGTG